MAEVKLSQASYDELLEDIEELRLQSDTYFELWQNARLKAEAFDEIKKYTLDKIETLTTRQEFAPNSNDFEYFGNLLISMLKVYKTKLHYTELQMSIDNSIQSVPLSDKEYEKQVKQYTFKEEQ